MKLNELLFLIGKWSGNGIKVLFRQKLFGNDPRMLSSSREFILNNNILKYEMKMAIVKNYELNTHLKAELKRES